MPATAAVCLNMILRDEAAIIERCLASVSPCIDYWVILDTGSSDTTPERVQAYFDQAGIPGELHRSDFVDFATTRNLALDHCRSATAHFDYILLIDADMELVVEDPAWRRHLGEPAYSIRQRNALVYDNVRLVQRTHPARYVGVTHEYLELQAPASRLPGVHMIDHACGSSRAHKFERDAALLRQGLEQEPGNVRYLFYLAQTLDDAGHHREALPLYRQRAAAGGWEEEAWYALYRAALAQRALGDEAGFVTTALEAWDRRPWRSEPLAAVARHYRESGRNQLACELAATGLRIPFPEDDRLFIESDAYPWRFAEELSISGYYAHDAAHRQLGQACCNRLAIARDAPAHMREQARRNLAWYAHDARSWLGLDDLTEMQAPMEPGWQFMNPSLCRHGEHWMVLLRQVNYSLVAGRYDIHDPGGVIRTRNWMGEMSPDFVVDRWCEVAPKEDAELAPRYPFPVRGYEDCRLFRWRDAWWALTTVRDTTPEGWAEMALLRLEPDGTIISEQLLRGDWSTRHQKNWMPIVDGDELLIVYSLDPTCILRVDPARLQADTWRTSQPDFACEHLRGGTQLIPTGGGWLGLCHEVAVTGDGQRNYLHRFFMLDGEFRLVSITEPFRFTGDPIEFCAGMALAADERRLIVSFGVHDARALLGTLSLDRVMAAMAPSH